MKIGLALCGGGLKGSYQAGALKALLEENIHFDVITGTSIGSINGLMVFQNDYTLLENTWDNITSEDIIKIGKDIKNFNLKEIFSKAENIKIIVGDYFKNFGIDILPFKTLLKKSIDINKMDKDKVLFGVVVTEFPTMQKREILLNNLDEDMIYNYILASSSCFPFFPVHRINDKTYIDGGYTDNLPIEFAFKLGCDFVYAIDLNYKITHPKFLNNTAIIQYIYPKIDLGSFMTFDKNIIKRNSILGYYDTLKIFNRYMGILYTFEKSNLIDFTNLITNISISLKEFLSKYKENSKKSERKLYDHFLKIYFKSSKKITDEDLFFICLENLAFLLKIDYTKIYKISELIKIINFEFKRKKDTNNVIPIIQKRRNFFKKFKKNEILFLFNENSKYHTNTYIDDLFAFSPDIIPAIFFILNYQK